MTHAQRVLAQLKKFEEDPETPEEQRQSIRERIDEIEAEEADE